MSDIRSLADELRQAIRTGGSGDGKTAEVPKPARKKRAKTENMELEALFARISAHGLEGGERLPVRLDGRTAFLLKQLKVIRGIDMNRFVAFCVHHFLESHPEITGYVKENIKTIEL